MFFEENENLNIDESIKEVVEWRRYFHQNPELSYQEINTSQFVYDILQSFGNLTVTRPTKTSVMAVLEGGKRGETIAYRADMDALPIDEETDLPYSSVKKGVMHACGHDGHTAMLLGLAKICSRFQSQIEGEIRFIFQHSEEMFPGGAKELVEKGVMQDVDKIVALHLFTMIPTGKIAISPGYVTANSDIFEFEIQGKGGHASEPDQAVDPIVIGSEIVSNLQQIISRKLPSPDNSVLSITEFQGGTAKNIIPDTVTIGGGVRSFNQDIREQIVAYMEQIIKGISEAHSASYNLDYVMGYKAVYNDEELTSRIRTAVKKKLEMDSVIDMPLFMGGEDFSAYLENTPGCFIGIGAAPKNNDKVFPHHHPKFQIDEKSLEIGLKVLLSIVEGLQTSGRSRGENL